MPDLSELSFDDYDKQVRELKQCCTALQITNESIFDQAKRESQAYSRCRIEILKLVDGLDYAIKMTNQKIDAWHRRPVSTPKKTVEAKQDVAKSTSMFDDFDAEPLNEGDAMALEINKSLNGKF